MPPFWILSTNLPDSIETTQYPFVDSTKLLGWYEYGCYWPKGQDIYSYGLVMDLLECEQTCNKSYLCTHHTHNSLTGYCWLKYGSVSQNNTIKCCDASVVCGIVKTNIRVFVTQANHYHN